MPTMSMSASGVKRTSLIHALMSANDPKRTSTTRSDTPAHRFAVEFERVAGQSVARKSPTSPTSLSISPTEIDCRSTLATACLLLVTGPALALTADVAHGNARRCRSDNPVSTG